ncbi:hypothetical protein Ac42p091 [Acinetobacter phage Ac42]|uniref:hypothetical protein n=1 Tax=Acinetobacter phage Ac42 TaxID=762660 RepID=UPI0001EBCCF5|nr:hypothetical protein Ac42p091 [Acinetobacter phage Ac42]ADI96329.1 hypothetical protein Ac42p091 [Acinetobacter phage Ac42]
MKKVFPLVGVLCKNKVSGEESIVHRAGIVSGPFIQFYTLDSKITNKQMNDWVFAWVDSDDEEETQWLCITDWIKKYETTHRLVGALAIRQGSGLK